MEAYEYHDPIAGITAPGDGQIGWAEQERLKADYIGRWLGSLGDAVGVGVIAGGVGSVDVSGGLAITAVDALIADDIGAVPVSHAAEVIAVGEFGEGNNWVHLQLETTARADGTCGTYVSASATPGAESIALCQVTVASGAITAFDNTVKAVPAIALRIPWEVLRRNYDDSTTLLALLTAMLGARYLDDTAPGTVDGRLTAVESGGGGGGGGGGAVSWDGLERLAGVDATTIAQASAAAIAAALADHIALYHAGGGGGTGTALEPWDGIAAAMLHTIVRETAAVDRGLPENLGGVMVYVAEEWGDGAHGGPDYRYEGT